MSVLDSYKSIFSKYFYSLFILGHKKFLCCGSKSFRDLVLHIVIVTLVSGVDFRRSEKELLGNSEATHTVDELLLEIVVGRRWVDSGQPIENAGSLAGKDHVNLRCPCCTIEGDVVALGRTAERVDHLVGQLTGVVEDKTSHVGIDAHYFRATGAEHRVKTVELLRGVESVENLVEIVGCHFGCELDGFDIEPLNAVVVLVTNVDKHILNILRIACCATNTLCGKTNRVLFDKSQTVLSVFGITHLAEYRYVGC